MIYNSKIRSADPEKNVSGCHISSLSLPNNAK